MKADAPAGSEPSKEDPAPERAEGEGSSAARRKAMLILEVLGGVRSPAEVSEELGVPTATYYQWEERGVAGLVSALEPRKRGRTRDPQQDLAALRTELEGARQECARYEALLRSAHRALGLTPRERTAPSPKKKGKRSRRPRVRALTALRKLERSDEEPGDD